MFFFLVLARPAQAVEPLSFDTGRGDTIAHVLVSYGAALHGTLFLRYHEFPRWKAALLASGGVFLLGVAKELTLDTEFSVSDVFANAVGSGLSFGMVWVFEI